MCPEGTTDWRAQHNQRLREARSQPRGVRGAIKKVRKVATQAAPATAAPGRAELESAARVTEFLVVMCGRGAVRATCGAAAAQESWPSLYARAKEIEEEWQRAWRQMFGGVDRGAEVSGARGSA